MVDTSPPASSNATGNNATNSSSPPCWDEGNRASCTSYSSHWSNNTYSYRRVHPYHQIILPGPQIRALSL
jgi:hypothetical protein